MAVIENVKSIYPSVAKRCLVLEDTQGRVKEICYPDITDAVLRGKAEITELHRGVPLGPDVTVYFDTPVTCEITDKVLRCPSGELASWER